MTDRNPAAMGKSGKAGERARADDGKGKDRDKLAAGVDGALANAHKSPKKRRKVNHGTHSYSLIIPLALKSTRDCSRELRLKPHPESELVCCFVELLLCLCGQESCRDCQPIEPRLRRAWRRERGRSILN